MYTQICAKYKVTAINQVTMGTVYLFDIYYSKNIIATLHMDVPLHCFCSSPIDPHISTHITQNLVSDTKSYKIMDINVKKYIWLPNAN